MSRSVLRKNFHKSGELKENRGNDFTGPFVKRGLRNYVAETDALQN